MSAVYGQADLTSPYSLFGPGLPFQRQTVSQAGVGGSGIALFDSYKMNLGNPATVALHYEPIFETSGKSTISTYNTNAGSFDNKSFILNNLSLSFPIKRGIWGLSIGLVPYSVVGYSVQSNITDEEVSSGYNLEYSGDGGISQGYLGMGYRIWSHTDTLGNLSALSLGGTLNFNFGTIDSNRKVDFPDDINALGINIQETVLVRDVSFDLGVHFQKNILRHTHQSGRYMKLMLGAVYTMGNDLKADRSEFAYSFRDDFGLVPRDTIINTEAERGRIHMPQRLSFGVGLDYVTAQKARYRFSADYAQEAWSDYTVSYQDDALDFDFNDASRLSAGIEYTPMMGSRKYFKVVEYRAGVYYDKSNLNLEGEDIVDRGMSFGLTMPINHRRAISRSSVSISTQYGQSGTTNKGLIEEDYWRIYIGFSFTPHVRNRWFIKPKYD